METYKHLSVSIPFDTEEETWKKLAAYAEKRGITIEQAFHSVATIGLYGHISRNLDFLEKYDI